MHKIISSITKRILQVEKAFSVALLFVSITMIINNVNAASFGITYIWAISLLLISLVQFIGLKSNRILLRLIGSWFSFIIWTWLAFAAINIGISIIALTIGVFNLFIFISLTNRIQFNWIQQLKTKNVD